MVTLILFIALLLPAHPGSDVQHQRSVTHYLAAGCFQVAPRQFICPMPAPKRSHMSDGGGNQLPTCGGSYLGTYFSSAGHEFYCSWTGAHSSPPYWSFVW